MALIVSAGGDYTPCPSGLHPAVCVDVHDLGMVETQWGPKHRVAIIWAVDERDERGRMLEARQVFGFSLNSKATLRKVLESWRGRGFTAKELLGFDLESVIGTQAQINVVHVQKGDRTYANITAVLPGQKGQKLKVPADYIRRKDRPPTQPTASGVAAAMASAVDAAMADAVPDDDVPF